MILRVISGAAVAVLPVLRHSLVQRVGWACQRFLSILSDIGFERKPFGIREFSCQSRSSCLDVLRRYSLKHILLPKACAGGRQQLRESLESVFPQRVILEDDHLYWQIELPKREQIAHEHRKAAVP